MVSVTSRIKTEAKVENKDQDAKRSIDDLIQEVKVVDAKCRFEKCKARTELFAIQCKFCNKRFCTSHGLPEIHGCGDAVRREEKRKMMHPNTKLNQEKHSQAQTKLNMKLKQMQLERKKQVSKKK